MKKHFNFIAFNLYGDIIATGETMEELQKKLNDIDPFDIMNYTIES